QRAATGHHRDHGGPTGKQRSMTCVIRFDIYRGGRIVDGFSVSTVMICGGLTALLMAVSLWSLTKSR
ncbi:hypothetical protein, partial [Nonomuraea fuscirosea]|uniref:hypothetical protein n=1 Tax=Nonomuraea fuscirosea TaxID=1291556 RepID=UPI003424A058